MASPRPASAASPLRIDWRLAILIVLAAAYAAPLAYNAWQRFVEFGVEARTRLIEQHQLWEVEPGYRGSTRMYTRVASRLLSDTQLITRIHAKYGSLAPEIELEFRRDLAIGRTLVVVKALALWAAPVGGLYFALTLWRRRKRAPAPKVESAGVLDPRYRPTEPGER